MSMSFYCIPTSPGQSRVMFSFAFNFLPPIAKIIPRWYSHWGQMMVLDSDHYFLHLLVSPALFTSWMSPSFCASW